MKFNTTLLISILSFGAFLVQASPLVEGYTVTNGLKYIGPITPGGANVTLEGTVEDIHAQIMVLNPKFNPDDFEGDRGNHHKLQARSKSHIICNVQGGLALRGPIADGVRFLKGLPGGCYAPAGPRACIRISCSYDSAIFLCNDNSHVITPSCKYLATFAEDITERCRDLPRQVNGQEFDTDRFNIIIKRDHC